MTDVRKLLNDGDPLRLDGGSAAGLSTVDAERMRRVVVAAALESRPSRAPWQRPFVMAAVGALLVRDFMAARRLGFAIRPDGTVEPFAGLSLTRIKRVARSLAGQ